MTTFESSNPRLSRRQLSGSGSRDVDGLGRGNGRLDGWVAQDAMTDDVEAWWRWM